MKDEEETKGDGIVCCDNCGLNVANNYHILSQNGSYCDKACQRNASLEGIENILWKILREFESVKNINK